MSRQAGFTLIEVMVATMILGVIITAVLGPLTGMFGLTRKSMAQTDATSVAQATLEDVRGQWLNWGKYDAGCVTGDAFPATVTVSVQNLDTQLGLVGSATPLTRSTLAACLGSTGPRTDPAPTTSPALRRLTVTATVGGRPSTLVTEVAQSND
ncbi:type IV pilus modification PilV family protein [Deinococcus koreensis]|uniref:Prepilin-type cleavage/methylation domain-containing protein n=1 Tax=Deinococcus koreensis TaxID=2054903 RepID=A0A2K3UYB2_9DEIO|nr:type II secretion system protein [Deinococcus koreensis]PNY81529.1 hypothetical protein CVO96_09185 [Deinococcus koreensis]